MLTVLSLLGGKAEKVSHVLAPFDRYFATGEINFEVADKEACLARLVAEFSDAEVSRLDGISLHYADWWCNVRPSNTEPVLRLNLEAKTSALRDQQLAKLETIIGPRHTGHS